MHKRRTRGRAGVTKAQYVIAGVVVALSVATIVLYVTTRVGNTGNIKTIGVTADTDRIDWGDVFSGTTKVATIMLTNTGNTDGNLTMTTVNMPSYLTLTWDAENASLIRKTTRAVVFTLAVNASAPEVPFSFDIIITLSAEVKQ